MKAMTDVIGFWPDIDTFARDAGVSKDLAMVWRSRGTIPYVRWARLERAARKRRLQGFSLSALAELAETTRARTPRS